LVCEESLVSHPSPNKFNKNFDLSTIVKKESLNLGKSNPAIKVADLTHLFKILILIRILNCIKKNSFSDIKWSKHLGQVKSLRHLQGSHIKTSNMLFPPCTLLDMLLSPTHDITGFKKWSGCNEAEITPLFEVRVDGFISFLVCRSDTFFT
ncbi:MAG: hypothetical protein QQN55_08945, partial [Nitrosopumilus sp.]